MRHLVAAGHEPRSDGRALIRAVAGVLLLAAAMLIATGTIGPFLRRLHAAETRFERVLREEAEALK